jgi:outer membrane protein assembly factor BamB
VDASTLVWEVTTDPQDADRQIEFEGATGPVVYAGKVFAYVRCAEDPNSQVAAWDTDSGRLLWSTLIDPACDGSWSTPCVDTRHNSVLIGSGYRVFALDVNDGSPVWASPAVLEGSVVNPSICVASDLPHARALITDASYQVMDGQGGHLYCINLDANEPNNPYEPGQILWAYHLGNTMGDSPSYLDGVVYVVTADPCVYAFDATATSEPTEPIWTTQCHDRIIGPFWGGVTVTPERFLYAATYLYDLSTGQNNSTLVKIDCTDGRIVWTTAVERTDTIPVVVRSTIFVSGGAAGDYGSRPKVQAFRDLGDRAELAWDTSVSLPDEVIGGWIAQPTYASGKLYVGTQSQPYWDLQWHPNGNGCLHVLDVTRQPGDEGFLIGHVEGCGNSPAVTSDGLYSIGPNALMKFCQP